MSVYHGDVFLYLCWKTCVNLCVGQSSCLFVTEASVALMSVTAASVAVVWYGQHTCVESL
jgi:hypothetical protein